MPGQQKSPGKQSKGQGADTEFGEELVLPFVECVIDESGRRQLPDLIDEMNLAEIPIALIARQNTSITRLNLSSDGRRYLQSEDGHLLPSALAQRAVLGLLNLYRDHDPSYQYQVFTFQPRRLVENYVHPERSYRASAREVSAVLDQLKRVAHMRIRHDRWYDRSRGCSVEIDAAIIDYIKIIREGDNNTPTEVEVAWGLELWKSLRSRYTKELDWKLYTSIAPGIDLQLYRWVSRQLAQKPRQRVKSIYEFAIGKLGMHGSRISKVGRTASTYVAKQLEASVKRLNGKGYPVRLTIDRSTKDFSLLFERLNQGPNEVFEVDDVGDLLRHFARVVHGATKRTRFADTDRGLAQAWLEQYGSEASIWMTTKAAQIFRGDHKGQKPKLFRALATYEDTARGAWEYHQSERAGQCRLPMKNDATGATVPTWSEYVDQMLKRLSTSDDTALSQEVEVSLQDQIGSVWENMGKVTRKKMVAGALRKRKIAMHGLIDEATYEAVSSHREKLDAELKRCHGLSIDDIRQEA